MLKLFEKRFRTNSFQRFFSKFQHALRYWSTKLAPGEWMFFNHVCVCIISFTWVVYLAIAVVTTNLDDFLSLTSTVHMASVHPVAIQLMVTFLPSFIGSPCFKWPLLNEEVCRACLKLWHTAMKQKSPRSMSAYFAIELSLGVGTKNHG